LEESWGVTPGGEVRERRAALRRITSEESSGTCTKVIRGKEHSKKRKGGWRNLDRGNLGIGGKGDIEGVGVEN